MCYFYLKGILVRLKVFSEKLLSFKLVFRGAFGVERKGSHKNNLFMLNTQVTGFITA